MSKAIYLDNNLGETSRLPLPDKFSGVKEHNLYLYVKSYLASVRENSAVAKTRGEVSGGGKKPWRQKGGGRARAGSITSPIFVGGGVAHGPQKRNYNIKINKKQKRLALECALLQKANANKLYVIDSINIESGKTKDAFNFYKKLGERNLLLVANLSNDKTMLAFRNLKNCYLIDINELNAYLIAAFRSVVIEKNAFDELVKGGK